MTKLQAEPTNTSEPLNDFLRGHLHRAHTACAHLVERLPELIGLPGFFYLEESIKDSLYAATQGLSRLESLYEQHGVAVALNPELTAVLESTFNDLHRNPGSASLNYYVYLARCLEELSLDLLSGY